MNFEVEARRARDQPNPAMRRMTRLRAGGCGPGGVIEVAPDHRLHRGGEIERLRLIGDAPAVAKDHDAVGDAPDVAKAMGDVEHADAASPQAIDHREQALGLHGRQTGGRLVQDEDRRVGGDGAGDGDKLTMSRTERAEVLIERRVKSDAVGDRLARRSIRRRETSAPAPPPQSVQQQVLGDTQAGNAKLIGRLVDDDDSRCPRRLRRGEEISRPEMRIGPRPA